MSEPNTKPGEIARIKTLSDSDPRWEEALTKLAMLVERSEEARHWQRNNDEWRSEHDRNDAANFAELRSDVATLKSNFKGVSSKVETEKDNNRYTLRQMVGGLLILCGAIGGVIAFMMSMLHGGKP